MLVKNAISLFVLCMYDTININVNFFYLCTVYHENNLKSPLIQPSGGLIFTLSMCTCPDVSLRGSE